MVAWWDPAAGDLQLLRCADIATGRVLFQASGPEIGGALWLDDETLWVVRQDGLNGFRVHIHVAPDGGLIGVKRHVGLRHTRYRLEHGADGTVMIAPPLWQGGARRNTRSRPALVLQAPDAELVGMLDPDTVSGFEASGECRQAVATLSPDGDRIAVAYGATASSLNVPGTLAILPARSRDSVRTPAVQAKSLPKGTVLDLRWLSPSLLYEQRRVRGAKVPDAVVGRFFVTERSGTADEIASEWNHQPHDGSPLDLDHQRDAGRLLTVLNPNQPSSTLASVTLQGDLSTHPSPFAFGAFWASAPGSMLYAARQGQSIKLARCAPEQPREVSLQVKLDGREVESLKLERSPGGTYAVLSWKKSSRSLRASDVLPSRLALVSLAPLQPPPSPGYPSGS